MSVVIVLVIVIIDVVASSGDDKPAMMNYDSNICRTTPLDLAGYRCDECMKGSEKVYTTVNVLDGPNER